MAKARVLPHLRGAVDAAASGTVGPELVYSDENCLVSVLVPGHELSEADVHGGEGGRFGDGRELVEAVAERLAELHSLKLHFLEDVVKEGAVKEGANMPNMLWSSLDAMLEQVEAHEAKSGGSVTSVVPNLTASSLRSLTSKLRAAVTELECSTVLAGHGDFKPTNVMVTPERKRAEAEPCVGGNKRVGQRVVLIDFELGGPNYVGFDVCKLFRTAAPTKDTAPNTAAFAAAYLLAALGRPATAPEVALLLAEASLFLPLTWLEAGVFFRFAAACDEEGQERWMELAEDRLGKLGEVMETFDERRKVCEEAKARVKRV